MVKTNKVIYPFKINISNTLLNRLKEDFKDENKFDNFIPISDTNYRASLSFLMEEEGMLFFSLSKCDNHNIDVIDFQTKEEIPSFLNSTQKVKNHSLFVIIEDSNTLLVLYNHHCFRYLMPTLHRYLEIKGIGELPCKIMTKEYEESDINKYCENARQIIIERARENPQTFTRRTRGSSRSRIKRYMKKTEDIIRYQKLNGLPQRKIFSIVKAHLNRNIYDSIIINTRNMGRFDILDDFVIHFECDIGVNEDGLAIIDEFKEEIKRIKQENNNFFSGYELPS